MTDSVDLKARKIVTEHCLIAADVDRTLLAQNRDEFKEFQLHRAPELIRAASIGVNVAFLSGNSMAEVSQRILWLLVDELLHHGQMNLLDKFHFFSNSGGVYFRFTQDDSVVAKYAECDSSNASTQDIVSDLTENIGDSVCVRPRYINQDYVERCMIKDPDMGQIRDILGDICNSYNGEYKKRHKQWSRYYNLDQVGS